jgi:pyruvate dehydrogenase E2 component (dihydrolipoamide acetyltransferase)
LSPRSTAPFAVATEIKLPRLGQGMEAGTIVRWLKSEGEQVQKGEPLYELDTDKVTQEVEADASGVLLQIAVQEGEVPVGQTIAVIGEEGEQVSAAREESSTEDQPQPSTDEQPQEEGSRAPARDEERERGKQASSNGSSEQVTEIKEPARADGRVKASPLARRIARERGIDLGSLHGTGPEGRIVAEDVERAATAPAVTTVADRTGDVERVPLTSLRKTIARRMTEAWEAPAFQISMSADMTRAVALRERLLERAKEGVRPSYNDILIKVCAAALMRHRDVNARFAGDAVELLPSADIGIAVAVPNGLIVPVVRAAEVKSIEQIAAESRELVTRTREGKLRQEDLEGGSFTISNLGMYGVEQFTAVLNPPQAAILAVGALEERVVVRNGEFEARPLMTMTLTCDHRSLDGATASEFLRTVKDFLEEPGLAL